MCRIESILELPPLSEVHAQTSLPNDNFGSDHLLIACKIAFLNN